MCCWAWTLQSKLSSPSLIAHDFSTPPYCDSSHILTRLQECRSLPEGQHKSCCGNCRRTGQQLHLCGLTIDELREAPKGMKMTQRAIDKAIQYYLDNGIDPSTVGTALSVPRAPSRPHATSTTSHTIDKGLESDVMDVDNSSGEVGRGAKGPESRVQKAGEGRGRRVRRPVAEDVYFSFNISPLLTTACSTLRRLETENFGNPDTFGGSPSMPIFAIGPAGQKWRDTRQGGQTWREYRAAMGPQGARRSGRRRGGNATASARGRRDVAVGPAETPGLDIADPEPLTSLPPRHPRLKIWQQKLTTIVVKTTSGPSQNQQTRYEETTLRHCSTLPALCVTVQDIADGVPEGQQLSGVFAQFNWLREGPLIGAITVTPGDEGSFELMVDLVRDNPCWENGVGRCEVTVEAMWGDREVEEEVAMELERLVVEEKHYVYPDPEHFGG